MSDVSEMQVYAEEDMRRHVDTVVMPRRSQEAYCNRAVCPSVCLLQAFLVAR